MKLARIHRLLAAGALVTVTLSGCGQPGAEVERTSEPLSFSWPPVAGERYPDVELLDHRGELMRLSSFEGRVVLVEPIGMT